MSKAIKISIVIIVAAGAVGVYAYKANQNANSTNCPATGSCSLKQIPQIIKDTNQNRLAVPTAAAVTAVGNNAALPLLLDLGSHSCIPCKMMTPILDELKKEYTEKFKVEFIDVKENPAAGEKYNIYAIPTQIFFDSSGKELFRHEGFYPKEEILKKWQELGVAVQK